MPPTLLFASAAYNLAETTRCIEIAKVCKTIGFDVVFASFGGEFDSIITKEGYELHSLNPQLTNEKIDHLYKIDQGQKFAYFFTKQEVEEQVQSEIDLYKKLKPVAVITGFVFSNNISCKVLDIKLIWLSQSTWNMTSMLKQGLGSYPDMMYIPFVPEWLLVKLSIWALSVFMYMFKPFNQVANQYNIEQIHTAEKLWEGDYNLLPEPPSFCPIITLDDDDNAIQQGKYYYIGPLIGRLDTPIPDVITNMVSDDNDKPIVYFAMGSSGQPKVIASIIQGFTNKPYRVIAPVQGILDKLPKKDKDRLSIPDNVIVTGWIPAHKVNPLADISVIHGGIGTVFTACLAGKPVVGIGMMIEQEYNIDCLVRLGFATRIRKRELSPKRLCDAIDQLLRDDNAKTKAIEFQKECTEWDNPSSTKQFFTDKFLNK